MGNLFTSLLNSSNSLKAYERSLSVVGNNVANASTPGYARQSLSLVAKAFDTSLGLSGGVETGLLISYRNNYAEQSVWNRQQSAGWYAQRSDDLTQVEGALPVAEGAGIPAALNTFFQAVSSWSVSPNDTAARQVVLDRAAGVATALNQTAATLDQAKTDSTRRLDAAVASVNSLAHSIQNINKERRKSFESATDSGLDAKLHNALEELSDLADFTAINEPDGTVSVLLGGQIPLVLGASVHELGVDKSGTAPVVLNSSGQSMKGVITQGRLGALMDVTGTVLPDYMGDMNQLATTFADTVNNLLRGGLDIQGNSPAKDLFTYNPLAPATSLATTDITTDELAAASAGSPGGNGNALALAKLIDAKTVEGKYTFAQYYGNTAARAGRELSDTQSNASVAEQLAAQAREVRAQYSGVDLNLEATQMIEFQRSYQANAKLFQTLDELTQEVINLIR